MGKLPEQTSVLELIDSSPALRRAVSARSPAYFDVRYARMRFAAHRGRMLDRFDSEFHRAQASLATDSPIKTRLILIEPRGHGKTQAVCSFIARAVCFNRSVRCLLICETLEVAEKRLGRIKEILCDERVQQDFCSDPSAGFGPFEPPRGTEKRLRTKWGERLIQVVRPQSYVVDPTVEAVGLGGATTGGHFDIIAVDDPVTDKNVRSPTMRREQRAWFSATIQPMLEPGGLEFLIGTRKHGDDLYHHCMESPSWGLIREPAILKWPDKATPRYDDDEHGRQILVGWDIEGDHEVLWPEERPLEFLLDERETMTSLLFEREYQSPVDLRDDETSPFPRQWLDVATQRGANLELYTGDVRFEGTAWPENLLIVQGWDPAFTYDKQAALERDTDYAVGITLAADVRTRDRYLMGIHRERGHTPVAKAANVEREWKRFAPPPDAYDQDVTDYIANGWVFAVAMEKNAAGELHRIDVEGKCAEVPVIPHHTGAEVNDPFKGVPALGALFERGKMVLPFATPDTRRDVSVLVDELHGVGTAKHDDTVKALWIAEVLLRKALAVYDDFVEG